MTNIEIGWLAGILEGEGCFSAYKILRRWETKKHGTRERRHVVPRITLRSTDHDVVETAARLMGSKVVGPFKTGHKPVYTTDLTHSKAVEMMKFLKPHMHSRRVATIEKILNGPLPPSR
jgi:hypothetical protein